MAVSRWVACCKADQIAGTSKKSGRRSEERERVGVERTLSAYLTLFNIRQASMGQIPGPRCDLKNLQ